MDDTRARRLVWLLSAAFLPGLDLAGHGGADRVQGRIPADDPLGRPCPRERHSRAGRGRTGARRSGLPPARPTSASSGCPTRTWGAWRRTWTRSRPRATCRKYIWILLAAFLAVTILVMIF